MVDILDGHLVGSTFCIVRPRRNGVVAGGDAGDHQQASGGRQAEGERRAVPSEKRVVVRACAQRGLAPGGVRGHVRADGRGSECERPPRAARNIRAHKWRRTTVRHPGTVRAGDDFACVRTSA